MDGGLWDNIAKNEIDGAMLGITRTLHSLFESVMINYKQTH